MITETQEFWQWLIKQCQTSLIVRILANFSGSEKGEPNLVGTEIHLFFNQENGVSYHCWQRVPEILAKHPVTYYCEELTVEIGLSLCKEWTAKRLEDWFNRNQIVVTATNGSYTTCLDNPLLVREELAKLYGFLIGVKFASPAVHSDIPIILKRLQGLRLELRRKAYEQIADMRELLQTSMEL